MKNPEGRMEHMSEEEGPSVEDALRRAGLLGVEAPREGTPAYERLIETAKNYMSEVKKDQLEKVSVGEGDSENYFSGGKKKSSGTIRREYHDKLCLMLLGKGRKGVPKELADQVSDFVAYLTDNERYVGTW